MTDIYVDRCIHCGRDVAFEVDATKLNKWYEPNRPHVQHLFPELTSEQREFMISKTCGPCFDAMFAEEEVT